MLDMQLDTDGKQHGVRGQQLSSMRGKMWRSLKLLVKPKLLSFIVMTLCPQVSPKYNKLQLIHVLFLQTDEVEINLRVGEICINIILYVNVVRYRLSTVTVNKS